MAKKLIVGIGSVIVDTTEKKTPQSFLDIIDAKVIEANKSRAPNDQLPIITGPDGGHVNDLYPIFKEAFEEHKDSLDYFKHPGGSIYNTFAAAELLLENSADDVEFYHIPTYYADTYIFTQPETGKKIMATNRPPRDVSLTDNDRKMLAKADCLFAPASSYKGYYDLMLEATECLPSSAKTIASFHDSGTLEKKVFDLMLSADVVCGKRDELCLDKYKDEYDSRLANKNKDLLMVITGGDKGLEMRGSDNFYDIFPAPSVTVTGNTSGAGNGVSGAILLHAVDMLPMKYLTPWKLRSLGNIATAAAAGALTMDGTALTRDQLPIIEDCFNQTTGEQIRLEQKLRTNYLGQTFAANKIV